MKNIIRVICVTLGFLFLGIGMLGMILPILPTTPFFLLAVFLFAKGSVAFHQWFLKTGLYRKYIEKAIHQKAMTKKEKGRMMFVLGILFLFGFVISPIWHARALIVVVAVGHIYYFLFKVRTVEHVDTVGEETWIQE